MGSRGRSSLRLCETSHCRVMAQVPRGPQGLQTKTITLSKTAFSESLSGAVGPKVMGYQYVLIKDGQLVTQKAGGFAQKSKDNGPLQMTTKTPINLGSLHKFISGTALINLMENPTKWSPGENKSLKNRPGDGEITLSEPF